MSEMKDYSVMLPLVGSLTVTVSAEDPEAAIEKARGAPFRLSIECFDDQYSVELGEEFSTPRQISEGNVLHAPVHEADAEEI